MPWKGANNIDAPGVTIDMEKLDVVAVSGDKKVAHVGPGLRWGPVYDALDKYNLTVVGGRSNTVGVGGYLLGSMVFTPYFFSISHYSFRWYIPSKRATRSRRPEHSQLSNRAVQWDHCQHQRFGIP